MELIEKLYQAILDQIEYFDFRKYEMKTVKVNADVEVDKIVYFIYCEVCGLYNHPDVTIFVDAWDNGGNRQVPFDGEVVKQLQDKMEKKFEDENS